MLTMVYNVHQECFHHIVKLKDVLKELAPTLNKRFKIITAPLVIPALLNQRYMCLQYNLING